MKFEPEPSRELAADGGLAGAHGSYQEDVRRLQHV